MGRKQKARAEGGPWKKALQPRLATSTNALDAMGTWGNGYAKQQAPALTAEAPGETIGAAACTRRLAQRVRSLILRKNHVGRGAKSCAEKGSGSAISPSRTPRTTSTALRSARALKCYRVKSCLGRLWTRDWLESRGAASPTTTPEPQRHSLLVQGYGLPTEGGRGGPRGAAALQGSTRQRRKELPSSSQSVQTQSRLFLGRTRSYFKQKGMNETQLKNFLGCIVVLEEVVYQAVDSSEAPAAKKMLDVLAQCREEIYPLIPKDTPASRPLHLTDLAQK